MSRLIKSLLPIMALGGLAAMTNGVPDYSSEEALDRSMRRSPEPSESRPKGYEHSVNSEERKAWRKEHKKKIKAKRNARRHKARR